ncbi:unnamed protein product [Colias eurytheme]|nr:unnamed protein product [Colias eurytheme]
MGFIPDAQLIFKSQTKSGDYHDDMNRENFMKWIKDKLLPNLPAQSIVVMDYASYHTVAVNKAPTMSSTKSEMQEWIVNKGLAYLPTMVKSQLFEIIKEHKEPPLYEVDLLLQDHGHKVVRLPPYHCDLNPIELIWGLLKRRIAEKNVGQEAKSIVKITEDAFRSITPEEWMKECCHVESIEDKYFNDGIAVDNEIDRFIIAVGDDSDTLDSSDPGDSDSSTISEQDKEEKRRKWRDERKNLKQALHDKARINKNVEKEQKHTESKLRKENHEMRREIITLLQGSNKPRDCTEEEDFWNILFSEDMLQIVVLHTNRKLQEMRHKYKKEDRPELKDIDVTELRALIGCILKIEDAEPEPSTFTKLEKRGTYTICPAKKKKTNVILMQEVWKTSVSRLS